MQISPSRCSMMAAGMVLAIVLARVGREADAADSELVFTKENVRTFYRGFRRVTNEPRLISSALSSLCRPATDEEIRREKAQLGPHYQTSVHLYVNKAGEMALTSRLPPFPEGSVVVKEKLGPGDAVTGIGGMVKRAPGSNPASGDWDFFYFDAESGFTAGKIQSCAGCHSNAREFDFVFSAGGPQRGSGG